MSPDDLALVSGIVHRRAGMSLGADKSYLVESRLQPLAVRAGLGGIDRLLERLRRSPSDSLADAVAEAMTVNETSFFRDTRVFESLREHALPWLARRPQARLWSAAASTGQEAWSIAVTLVESGLERFEIVATDLSADVVERATQALYSQFEAQRGLTIHRLIKHFRQEGTSWRVGLTLRDRVRFARHNLLEDAARLGRFDVVFLRNVMIYFDLATKRRVLERVHAVLAPGGYLYLGGTESLLGISNLFQPCSQLSCLYRRPPLD
jgi:chemotaxis protein methyltransferase CheR